LGSFGNYLEDKLLNHFFGKGDYTPPTIYVALSIADPGEAGAGMAEPSGNGYERKVTAPADWTFSSGGMVSNASELAFPEATGDWGTITHFALYDAPTGGNFLGYGTLSQSKIVGSGDVVKFAVGDLDTSLN